MDRSRHRGLDIDGRKGECLNNVVNMEVDCRALHKAWCNCLDADRPKCSLECMEHKPRGISYHIVNDHIGPNLIRNSHEAIKKGWKLLTSHWR